MKALRRNHTSSSKSLSSSSSPLLSSSLSSPNSSSSPSLSSPKPSSSSSSLSSSLSSFNRKHSKSKSKSKRHSSSPLSSSSSSPSSSWNHLRSVLFVVASSSPASSSSDRGHLKSPWSRYKRKHALTPHQWRSSFTPEGTLRDGGIKLLKKIRSGGIDPSIRAEVWPFLLGVFDLDSTKEARDAARNKNRKEYEKLRRQCQRLLKDIEEKAKQKQNGNGCSNGDCEGPYKDPGSPAFEDVVSARESLSSEKGSSDVEHSDNNSCAVVDGASSPQRMASDSPVICSDSSDSGSSDDEQFAETSTLTEEEDIPDSPSTEVVSPSEANVQPACKSEDFDTWQRIIRLDAVRANAEWIPYSPSQASVPEDRAHRSADAVGLVEYDHLEPCRVFHAARLVAILEAYAVYDSEIGYCQGMSDLLSPIISVIEDDHMAFWCFVGFMKRARHNFRLDEVGIKRQLTTVGKIIKYKDPHLYKHLVKMQAADCYFVYRMVVVLFRRELNFEQTLWLWEVMWADQTAIRAGIGKSAWSRIRQRAPPTEDLLLYAIAASVLQRRKQIIEKYSSVDEVFRECNSMAGQLDVWKLLDDAHDLVMSLHDKVDERPVDA